jgi:hypothetical protein
VTIAVNIGFQTQQLVGMGTKNSFGQIKKENRKSKNM